MIDPIRNILEENDLRLTRINAPFNPYSGKGAVGERERVVIEDFPIKEQWLPMQMLRVPLVKKLIKAKTIKAFIENVLKVEYTEEDKIKVIEQFLLLGSNVCIYQE